MSICEETISIIVSAVVIYESKSRSTDTFVVFGKSAPICYQCSTVCVCVYICVFALCFLGCPVSEVLCGHSGFQAAAALPQFAFVAVQGHLLQCRGGRQWGGNLHLRACSGHWKTKTKIKCHNNAPIYCCCCFL